MNKKQGEKSNWMKPGSRILIVKTGALLSHVTDQQILLYKHEQEYNIQTLQDVEDISITSQSLAKDSFTPTSIKTLQITHESLTKVFEGLAIEVNQPPQDFSQPLLLLEVQQDEAAKKEEKVPTLVFYFQSLEEVNQVSRAIQLSQAWIKYKDACNIYQLELDYDILDWIQESIQQEDLHFHEELDLYIECLCIFLMHSSAINYLKFTRDYSIDNNIMQDKHLLINVKHDQIFSLVFNHSNIDYTILKNLADVICQNNYLQSLNLSHNKLTDECLPLLHKVIESCSNLNGLDLSYNLFKGNRDYFYEFIDLINLLQDDIVTDFEEFGLKLVLSHNQIGDDIVDVVEQLILRPVRPRIDVLDLSFNQISKYNLWRLYKGYLNITKARMQRDVEQQQQQNNNDQSVLQGSGVLNNNPIQEELRPPVVLNIFPLPFHSDILTDSILIFSKMDSDTKRQECNKSFQLFH